MKRWCMFLISLFMLAHFSCSSASSGYSYFQWGSLKARNVDVSIKTDIPCNMHAGSYKSFGWNQDGYGGYAMYENKNNHDLAPVQTSGDYTYCVLPDGCAALIDIADENQTRKVIIPESIDGFPVTHLGYDTNIVVFVPYNEKFIFANNVEEVVIPSTVTVIGADVFSRERNSPLKVTMPDSILEIGSNLWASSYTYKSLPPKLERLGNFAFTDTSLSSIKLSGSLKDIGAAAFMETSLRTISLPSSLEHIGPYAFAYCQRLESATLNNGIPEISEGMFIDCWKLKKITLPASITAIGDFAFENCKALTQVSFNTEQLQSIGNGAFQYCRLLTKASIPDGVKSIGDRAFFDCSKLSSVTIPNSIEYIGTHAFTGCSSNLILTVTEGSYGYQWALENGFKTKVIPAPTAPIQEETGPYKTLKPGSKGQAVLKARMKLYELGYFSKKPTQTEYTNNMKDYVKKFEKDNGLKQDGVLSPEDQVVLFSL